MKYFGEMKRLGIWDKSFLTICEKKLPLHNFLQVLSSQKEYEMLLKHISNNPGYVFEYGKELVKRLPNETYKIYKTAIILQVDEATDRKAYKKVARNIKELSDVGGTILAISLIDEFLKKYNRRPAMVDELNKIRAKIGACG